jgi:hypothetical protein
VHTSVCPDEGEVVPLTSRRPAWPPWEIVYSWAELVLLVEGIKTNTGRKPREVSADVGYCSEANLKALKDRRIRGYVATGRQNHPDGGDAQRRGPQGRGHAPTAEARRTSQPLPIAQTDRRAGVRSDQAGQRLSTIPLARH